MATINLTEDMFKSGKPVAQGEVLIWLKKYAPKAILQKLAALKNMKEMPLEKGMLIMGHSETGAFHILEPISKTIPISKAALALIDTANDSYVDLKIYHDCALTHLRSNDNHAAFVLPEGEYIRGIREEQTVQGWVRVAD